jgi:hypothetical protein
LEDELELWVAGGKSTSNVPKLPITDWCHINSGQCHFLQETGSFLCFVVARLIRSLMHGGGSM